VPDAAASSRETYSRWPDSLARQPRQQEPLEGVSLLDGGVRGALQVRGDRLDQPARVRVAGVDEDGDLGQAGVLGGAVAALAVDGLAG
jgi:hypothetical protein